MSAIKPTSPSVAELATPLQYRSIAEAPPRRLTLESTEAGVRIIFPPPPTCVYALSIAAPLAVGLLYLISIGMFGWMMLKSWKSAGLPISISRMQIAWIAIILTFAFAICGVGVHHWRRLRRWGRIPVTLAADANGMTRSHLGFRSIRERHWPISTIASVELRPVRGNLIRNWHFATLIVRRSERRPLRFRLSSRDERQLTEIVEAVSKALDRPLIAA